MLIKVVALDEPVEVVAYDPSWPALFAREAQQLQATLGARALAIEHVGSTSVAGLAAKPVVDILLGVADLSLDAREAAALARLGYENLGEAGVPGRLYFRKRGDHSFNVHLAHVGGELWEGNLLLRDFLRAHPAEAVAYAGVKRTAAREVPFLLAYSERKASFIGELLVRAARWRSSTSGHG